MNSLLSDYGVTEYGVMRKDGFSEPQWFAMDRPMRAKRVAHELIQMASSELGAWARVEDSKEKP